RYRNVTGVQTSALPIYILLKEKPVPGMSKRLPFQITAQVVAVLTFKKLTVHTEQGSQQLTTDRKRINIILLKKTQTHASYGCLPLPVSSYGLRNAPRLSKSTGAGGYSGKDSCHGWGSPGLLQGRRSLCFPL